jgi:hypothetical protein
LITFIINKAYGAGNWTIQIGAPGNTYWTDVVSDSSGQYLVAVVDNGGLYTNQVQSVNLHQCIFDLLITCAFAYINFYVIVCNCISIYIYIYILKNTSCLIFFFIEIFTLV